MTEFLLLMYIGVIIYGTFITGLEDRQKLFPENEFRAFLWVIWPLIIFGLIYLIPYKIGRMVKK